MLRRRSPANAAVPPIAFTHAAISRSEFPAGRDAAAVFGPHGRRPDELHLDIRPRRAQSLYAVGSHAAVPDIDVGQLLQRLQARQPGIGDARPVEIERAQLSIPARTSMLSSLACAPRRFRFRICLQVAQCGDPLVRDARSRKVELLEAGQPVRNFSPSSVTIVSRRFSRRKSLSPASPSSALSLKAV